MKLVLFGAGKICREAIDLLEENGKRPDCIIDNDIKKVGQTIYGIPIISFKDFLAGDNAACRILITVRSEYVKKIIEQLEKNGFKLFDVYENKNWGVSANRVLRDEWVVNKLRAIEEGQSLLDAGAGEQKYRRYCDHLQYTSQDFCQYDGLNGDGRGIEYGYWDTHKIDIVSDVVNIPVADASFDNVLCTEVLEHIPQPETAIAEFARILKPGGILLLTAPFNSFTHMAPYHYCDGFNTHWYKYWLPKHGFEIKELKASGNFFSKLEQDIYYVEDFASKYDYELSHSDTENIRNMRKLLHKLLKTGIRDSSDITCYGYFCEAVKL